MLKPLRQKAVQIRRTKEPTARELASLKNTPYLIETIQPTVQTATLGDPIPPIQADLTALVAMLNFTKGALSLASPRRGHGLYFHCLGWGHAHGFSCHGLSLDSLQFTHAWSDQ